MIFAAISSKPGQIVSNVLIFGVNCSSETLSYPALYKWGRLQAELLLFLYLAAHERLKFAVGEGKNSRKIIKAENHLGLN